MKTNKTLKVILTALLLAAGLSGANAAALLADGDFDSLPVGTAPDVNTPAGHWYWPADYLTIGGGKTFGETTSSQVTIVRAPGGDTGNCLQLSFTATEHSEVGTTLPNLFSRSVTKVSGEILHVSFDIYVEPGRGGGGVYLGKGYFSAADRGPQLIWLSTGVLSSGSLADSITLISSYPRGVWQTVRLEVDLGHDRFDFYWSEKGQPVSVIRTNLPFRSGSIPYIDRFHIVRFPNNAELRDAHSYFDNIRVTTDLTITPVDRHLPVGGATTLQLLNLKAGSAIQWQFNGSGLGNATNATLELSNVTTNQSGGYRAVVTAAGQSVTTEASTVRVFDQLTITTQPQSIDALAGKTTGFAVAAVSPLPLTYRWQRNGTDLAGKTSRFLTLTSLPSALLAAEGDYTVVVSDANGSVVSQPATLRVLITPAFVQSPLSQSVVAGGNVTFSAGITGNPAPFTYQWRKGTSFAASTLTANVESGERIAFLTLTNVQPADAGTYRLYLANAATPGFTSTSPDRSWALTVLTDTDGDGLPDEWETANGLNPATASDALLDSDGDERSNLVEYQSGTNATNAASGLKLKTVTHANSQATLIFPAAANQTYTVEWCANVAEGSWQKLVDIVAQSDDRQATVIDAGAADSARFYRVVTPRRP